MNLDCSAVDDLVEAIAAGDLTPNAGVADHIRTCTRCTARLDLARRLDRLLASTDPPAVPDQFVSSVLRRLRGDWWRSEQYLDRWFNVAIVSALALVAFGIWLLLNASGLTAVAVDASRLLASGVGALSERMLPALPVYGIATLILTMAFAVWWWAEREITW